MLMSAGVQLPVSVRFPLLRLLTSSRAVRGAPISQKMVFYSRSGLHRLFDQGYVTVDAKDLKLNVSSRIREEFKNGRDYYQLHGTATRLRSDASSQPSREYLAYHNSPIPVAPSSGEVKKSQSSISKQ